MKEKRSNGRTAACACADILDGRLGGGQGQDGGKNDQGFHDGVEAGRRRWNVHWRYVGLAATFLNGGERGQPSLANSWLDVIFGSIQK